ncbi:MAG: DUF2800 domain-containing protein [Luteitalea sp.]|nr:DUF2800 domain-containing protein [Luteitalea sp.]
MTHSTRAHAKLSPSAAHRWFACPGSIRLSAGIVDKSSVYADEGTAAHMLAERCLTNNADADQYANDTITVRDGVEFTVDQEMGEAVQVFLDRVRHYESLGYEIQVEQRLDLGHLSPGQFGTGDAIAFKDGDLHLFEYKHGRGVAVDPKDNPQLLSYVSGAAKRYHNRRVEFVTCHVVQPRAPHKDGPVRMWATTPKVLAAFEQEFREAAGRTADPNAPLVAGDHCRFCPAAAICPALRDKSMEIARAEFDDPAEVAKLTPADVGEILHGLDLVEARCRRIREFAHQEANDGRTPEGWKLVYKRANRRWADEGKAAQALKLGFDLGDDEIFERKLVSPAKADSLVGKKAAAALKPLIDKTPSGTALAPVDDPRPAAKADASVEFGT